MTIDQLLEAARVRIVRLTPAEAESARSSGAVLVDIRPAAQRDMAGELPGALIIERNVLEWRFDPSSSARLPIADHDLQVIVVCQEGYTSSLAAAGPWPAPSNRRNWRLRRVARARMNSFGSLSSTAGETSAPTRD